MSIAENAQRIHERITAAARRAGRNPAEITLMAVTKTVEPARIRDAYQAGIRVFGENRVQEFAKKREALADLAHAEWHLIGHLQTNKAADAAELFTHIDSVDSLRLGEKLNSAAAKLNKKLQVLLEVNIAGEQSKSGIAREELDTLLVAATKFEHLQIAGLMAIPPFSEDPQTARPYFQKLRELRDRIAAGRLPLLTSTQLSMGMSHDFEVAIEEGSTCVRIGTAIFGERPKP